MFVSVEVVSKVALGEEKPQQRDGEVEQVPDHLRASPEVEEDCPFSVQ